MTTSSAGGSRPRRRRSGRLRGAQGDRRRVRRTMQPGVGGHRRRSAVLECDAGSRRTAVEVRPPRRRGRQARDESRRARRSLHRDDGERDVGPGLTRRRERAAYGGRMARKGEPPETRDGVSFSSLDTELAADIGVTKRALVDYLDGVADRLVPALRDRPLSVIRVRRGVASVHAEEPAGSRAGVDRADLDVGGELTSRGRLRPRQRSAHAAVVRQPAGGGAPRPPSSGSAISTRRRISSSTSTRRRGRRSRPPSPPPGWCSGRSTTSGCRPR